MKRDLIIIGASIAADYWLRKSPESEWKRYASFIALGVATFYAVRIIDKVAPRA